MRRSQRFTHRSIDHPIELLPEVPETLQYLSQRHRLILVTKGAVARADRESRALRAEKIFRRDRDRGREKSSGLRSASSKNTISTHDSTWMVGNSPKSDINPALAAGLHAVFVPHGDTWILEHEEINPAPRQKLLIVGRFAELREHF